jgi:N,N'-diacetyllegionaminate synthase
MLDITNPTFIIAEIGNNHEGSFQVAKKMLIEAAKTGVNAVKFQTFKAESYVGFANLDRFNQIKSYELSHQEFKELKHIADNEGVEFMSTPFDLESADFLNSLVSRFKISSSDNTFYPLIEKVIGFDKPIIISSGISTIEILNQTINFIKEIKGDNYTNDSLSILHCVSSYPTEIHEAQLGSIPFLKQNYSCNIGYSDHTLGIDACVLSVALGAKIVEKHFTLDHNYSSFKDHQISANPQEMRLLVEKIREAELYIGNFEKKIGEGEQKNISAIRRSIVAKRNISKGEIVSKEDLRWTRPSGGIPPGSEKLVIGKKALVDMKEGDLILEINLE